jgi:hypothetical protein
MLRLSLATLCLLLASCGSRPETRAYFKQVTAVPLCDGASVHNVNAHAPDRSPGFDSIYIVDVTMPAECKASFINAVAAQISKGCDPSQRCSGNSSTGQFLSVEPIRDGFRITHST